MRSPVAILHFALNQFSFIIVTRAFVENNCIPLLILRRILVSPLYAHDDDDYVVVDRCHPLIAIR
jgi:hypothetical protein